MHIKAANPQLLVAKSDNDSAKTIFCKVERLESRPCSLRAEEKQISEFVTYVDLELLKEMDETDGYLGIPRNQNLENFGLYLANGRDVETCFNLPLSGFPFGEMVLSEVHNQTILYHYPYNPNNYERKETEWLIDHSMFIVGNQGRGKTNALFYISLLLACNNPETLGQTVVNLCNEKQTSQSR